MSNEVSFKSYPEDTEIARTTFPNIRYDSRHKEDEDKQGRLGVYNAWERVGNNYTPVVASTQMLPSGYYKPKTWNHRVFLERMNINTDQFVSIPSSHSEIITTDILAFWTKRMDYHRFGFLWKRGILLWGPPGAGKTTYVNDICHRLIVNYDGIVLYFCNELCTDVFITALTNLRQIEPERKMILVFEDLDAILDEHSESNILSILDGELQIENVVTIATTNYPEKLDARIINRPNRFDIIHYVDYPTSAERRFYLRTKLPDEVNFNTEKLEHWVKMTEKYSIAHLRELIVLTQIFNMDLDYALDRLNKMSEKMNSSRYERTGKLGFM